MSNSRKLWISLSTAFCLLFPLVGEAAELVMFREHGCYWCEAWDKEIGPIYPKTAEGKRAPLRMAELSDGVPDYISDNGMVHYTPTFVMVEDGKEIGRIAGYPGEDHFWWMLEELVKKLPAQQNVKKGVN